MVVDCSYLIKNKKQKKKQTKNNKKKLKETKTNNLKIIIKQSKKLKIKKIKKYISERTKTAILIWTYVREQQLLNII